MRARTAPCRMQLVTVAPLHLSEGMASGLVQCLLAAAILGTATGAASAVADEPERRLEDSPIARERTRRVSLSFSLGSTSSGPADDIERTMDASGFNQTSGSFFGGGPISHPFSRTGFGEIGVPWMAAMGYSVTPLFLARAVVSNAPIGETLGYQSPGYYLSVKYSVATAGITGSFQLWDVFHAGLGPAIYIARSSQDSVATEIEARSATRIGGLLDLGFSLPPKTRFFFSGSLQYRLVGKVDVGPFTTALGNSPGPTLPSTSAWFNHVYWGLGLGIRL